MIVLETEIVALKTENGLLTEQLEKARDETIRTRRSLGNQLDRIVENQVDQVALELKKIYAGAFLSRQLQLTTH